VDIISGYMFLSRRKHIFHQKANLSKLPNAVDELESQATHASVNTDEDVSQEKVANLNTISACTHVSGDSMRTTAVFIAAIITSSSNISSTTCDAWASIVILLTITLMVGPLVKEVYSAYTKI
jgi:Co/Zn/Cd efflux system component